MSRKQMPFAMDEATQVRVSPNTVEVLLFESGAADSWPFLSKRAEDEIEWVSTGPEFTIHFVHSPFVDSEGNERHTFKILAGGSTRSGPPVIGNVNENENDTRGDYAYTVKSAAREMAADPGLSVTP